MEIYGFSILSTDMVTKKNSKKLHTILNKCQVENSPALPGRNLISTRNRRVRSVPAGRDEVSSRQTKIMYRYFRVSWTKLENSYLHG